jgi:hypothetical protein
MSRPIAAIVRDMLFGVVAIGLFLLAAWSAELFL